MARKKIGKESMRVINKVKSTYYVSIPIGIMRKFKWQDGQKVVIRSYGKNKLLVSDWGKR